MRVSGRGCFEPLGIIAGVQKTTKMFLKLPVVSVATGHRKRHARLIHFCFAAEDALPLNSGMIPAALALASNRFRLQLSRSIGLMAMLFGLLPAQNIAAAPLKITIASDSTAAYFPPTDAGGRWGWGQALSNGNFFSTNVVIDDLAASGRSSKSFYDEGRWAACLATHADYYFIQFGHNDGKISDPTRYTDPQTTFKSNLSNYVYQARTNGGIPVFLTPPTRRNYSDEHRLKLDDLQNYAQAMREVATNMDVPLLDVLPASIDFFEFVGKAKAPFYQAANTGTTPPTPGGDGTHFSPAGAEQHCYLIMEQLLGFTNAELGALRAEVRKQGVLMQFALMTNGTVQFRGSTNLVNWLDYGKPQAVPVSTVKKYFYIVGESKAFFTADVTN